MTSTWRRLAAPASNTAAVAGQPRRQHGAVQPDPGPDLFGRDQLAAGVEPFPAEQIPSAVTEER